MNTQSPSMPEQFDPFHAPPTRPMAMVEARDRVAVEGVVTAVERRLLGGGSALEALVADETGSLRVVFFGREAIGGVSVGRRLTVAGTVLARHGELAILNPYVWLSEQDLAPKASEAAPREPVRSSRRSSRTPVAT